MKETQTAVIGQTKKQSLTEAFINVAVGFIISLISTIIIFPLMDIASTPSKNLLITLFFTVISVLRSYGLRRYFNGTYRFNLKADFANFIKFMEGLAKDAPRETKW